MRDVSSGTKSHIGEIGKPHDVLEKAKDEFENIPFLKDRMIDLFHQRKQDAALKYANKILELEPTNPYALEVKVEILKFRGDCVEAFHSVDKAIELKPEEPFFWILKGRVTLFSSGPRIALKHIEKALQLSPNHPVALLEKGILLDLLEEYSDVLATANTLVEVTPNNPNAWLLKGRSLAKLGCDKEAFYCLEKALKLKHTDFYTIYEITKLLIKLGKYKDAIKGYDLLTKLDPKNPDVWLKFGSFYYNIEKYKEALKCYDIAIRLKVEEKITLKTLGRFIIDSDTRRLSPTEKILEAHYMDSIGLSYEMFSLPDSIEAMTYVAKHKKINDKNVKDWYTGGVTLYELGCYYEAINCFLRVIDKKPKFVNAWVGLTMALFLNQNFNKAVKTLTRTISLKSYKPGKYERLFIAAINWIEVINKIYEARNKRGVSNG